MSLLQVDDLRIAYGEVGVVHGVSLVLEAGGTLALVGESGAGKTQVAMAIPRLLGPAARVAGAIRFDGRDLLSLPRAELTRVRGAQIGMVFQDPLTSLNPYLTLGVQIAEVLELHRALGHEAALAEAARLLDAVRVADARRRLFEYPHQCSGGMRQRVLIAMALAARPRLLIADEPTSALDPTVQAQILRLLAELRAEFGIALLLVTHDLEVVRATCERVAVMRAGRIVEEGASAAVLATPSHPYTRELLEARAALS
ncbi:MAG TPA: ABC transporter ATP-binding protein [Candidatus Binatia bacterium]|nr:ABC transporter ATP-binding protein [Candidatus Binatia bacterium]